MRLDLLEGVRTLQWSGLHSGITDTLNGLTDEGEAGIRCAYGSAKLARLTGLKDRYDPDNVFHLNHNIRPHGQQPR